MSPAPPEILMYLVRGTKNRYPYISQITLLSFIFVKGGAG